MSFDRATGRLQGASAMERCAALAFAAGAKCSAPMHYRGFSIGARAVMSMIDQREIVVMLNDDARFAFPFGDGYWSLLLDRSFVYEGEIEQFLKSVADVDYTFVDGGANFGFWSVLASSRPFGSHAVVAIEASTRNAAKLTRNAELNGNRFKILHRAIGATTGNKVWLGGAKHEAFRVEEANGDGAGESVEMVSLDGLLEQGVVMPGQRFVIKLDVEGMEIDAAKGGKRLLDGETRADPGGSRRRPRPHRVAVSAERGGLPAFHFRRGEPALRGDHRAVDARPHQDQHELRLQRVRHQQCVLGTKDQIGPAINPSLTAGYVNP